MISDNNNNNKHVLVVGNLSDGFEFFGPFENGDEAFEWGSENFLDENLWVATLREPSGFIAAVDNGVL